MKYVIERSVTVITPTTGSPKLADAVRSVQSQTYKNIDHLMVIDGDDHTYKINKLLLEETGVTKNMKTLFLPYNTGANGYNGQRIYASIPHLVNSDYVFFLDEDNWYEPDHVRSLVDTIESQKLDWAYSFRKVFTLDKKHIADDNCESLGKWPIWLTHENPQYMIDTSAFAFTLSFIQKTCHLWHSGPWGEDRRYFYAIKDNSKWDTNYKHSLCYRIDGNPRSVGGQFFIEGNEVQEKYYKGGFPWLKT